MVSYSKALDASSPFKGQGEASRVPYWGTTEECLRRPWEKIATGIFLLDESYLFTVDYYSGYFEVD